MTGGAVAGLGIARVLSHQAVESIRDGRLIPIPPAFRQRPMPVHIVHAAHQQRPSKLRAFLDVVAPRLQRDLRSIDAILRSNAPAPV